MDLSGAGNGGRLDIRLHILCGIISGVNSHYYNSAYKPLLKKIIQWDQTQSIWPSGLCLKCQHSLQWVSGDGPRVIPGFGIFWLLAYQWLGLLSGVYLPSQEIQAVSGRPLLQYPAFKTDNRNKLFHFCRMGNLYNFALPFFKAGLLE